LLIVSLNLELEIQLTKNLNNHNEARNYNWKCQVWSFIFCFQGFPNKNCYILYIWCSIKSIFLISRKQELLFLWLKFHIWSTSMVVVGIWCFQFVSTFNYLHFISFNYYIISSFYKRWFKLTHLLVEMKLSWYCSKSGCTFT